MSAWIVRLCTMGLIVAMGTTGASGQADITGTIRGTVYDSTGALIPGVTVTVDGPAIFSPRTVFTNESAIYFIDNLPLGDYEVTFDFPGFRGVVFRDVNVRSNFTATLNVNLEVAESTESIVVIGSPPVVDVQTATTSTTFNSALLKEIPTGRDTWSTLAQVPGLAPSKFDVGGTESYQQTSSQVRGSASGQQTYNVNGLNLNYPGGSGGATAFYFDNDSFEEMQVVTDGAQAEIGVGGLQINMITRQGSNAVHGSMKGFYTTSKLASSRDYPVFAGAPIEAGTNITMMRDTHAELGLPVVRDRLWWYTGYRRYDINLAVPGIKREDGSAIKDNNHQSNVTARTDIALTSRQTLSLNWLYNDINRFYRRGSGFVDDVASGRQIEHAWIGQGQWTYTPTPTLILESRFGNMTLHFPQDYQPEVVPGTIAVVDTVLNTTKYARPQGATLTSTYHTRFNQTASYFAGGGSWGAHNLRVGFEAATMGVTNNARVYGDLHVRLANGVPLNAVLYNTPIQAKAHNQEISVFVQDGWMIGPLTVNVGLRYDRFTSDLPAQSSGAGSFAPERSFPESGNIVTFNDISPRVGVAYDVGGQGRSVLRASYGHYALLEGSRLASAVNPNAQSSTTVSFSTLGPDNYPLDLSENPIFQEGGAFTSIDPDLSRPYSRQITLGYEQQLFGDLRASAGYFFRDTVNNFSRINRAAVPEDYMPLTVVNPISGEPFTIYNLSPDKVGQSDFLISNFSRVDDNAYHGVEINVSKRLTDNWQVLGGFTAQRKKGTEFSALGDDLNDPNRDIFRDDNYLDNDSTYIFKMSGTYNLPKNVTVSGNFQRYTGYPVQPSALFRSGLDSSGETVALNQNSVTVPLARNGESRLDDVMTLNLRLGYRIDYNESISIDPTVDLYNVFNANTVTGVTTTFGPNYLRPQTMLGQRFVRFGVRVEF